MVSKDSCPEQKKRGTYGKETCEMVLPGLWVVVYSGLFTVLYLAGARWFNQGESAFVRPFHTVGSVGIAVLTLLFTFEFPWEEAYRRHSGREERDAPCYSARATRLRCAGRSVHRGSAHRAVFADSERLTVSPASPGRDIPAPASNKRDRVSKRPGASQGPGQ